MLVLLYVLFGISLVYIAATEKFMYYIRVYAIQGILLFGMALIELKSFSLINLLFILAETIIFKSIVVPYLLRKIMQRTGIYSVHKRSLKGNYTVILMLMILGISLLLAKVLSIPSVNEVYTVIAWFAFFTGLLLVSVRKYLFGHLVGFLIIENAVFLFSIAIGNEFPLLVNTGILLDIFIAVLVMSMFLTRIGHKMRGFEADTLSQLKD
jgi:hydrogenase-4 component E